MVIFIAVLAFIAVSSGLAARGMLRIDYQNCRLIAPMETCVALMNLERAK